MLWSAAPEERAGRPLLVLLHGYGSEERDLFGLVPFLPEEFVVAAVRAPLAPPFPTPGHSWFPIEGLHAARRLGHGRSGALPRMAGCHDRPRPRGPPRVLAGRAVTLQALRLRPERFAFAVNLAGYADPEPLPTDAELAGAYARRCSGDAARDDAYPGRTRRAHRAVAARAHRPQRPRLPRAHAQRLAGRARQVLQ